MRRFAARVRRPKQIFDITSEWACSLCDDVEAMRAEQGKDFTQEDYDVLFLLAKDLVTCALGEMGVERILYTFQRDLHHEMGYTLVEMAAIAGIGRDVVGEIQAALPELKKMNEQQLGAQARLIRAYRTNGMIRA